MKPNRKGVKNLGKAFKLFEGVANEVYDRGGDDEVLARMELKSVRGKIVEILMGVKKFAFVNLKLVAEGISVVTESFVKGSFWRTDSAPKLYFGDNFEKWVLASIPESVPAFHGTLTKTELTKAMYDSEILTELGQPKPFSVAEFSAIVRSLVRAQPEGESGALLTNGYASIFYVQLPTQAGEEGGRVVAVSAHWDSGLRDWGFDALGVGGSRWGDGDCVFSRS
ncbi:MAG: hypothetical protein AAB617_03000 [Patescibacteria group bacterium]